MLVQLDRAASCELYDAEAKNGETLLQSIRVCLVRLGSWFYGNRILSAAFSQSLGRRSRVSEE